MSTFSIGHCFPVIKGNWTSGNTYEMMNIVYYNGSSYICKQANTGKNPADNPAMWQAFAAGAELSGNLTQEQLDLITNSVISQGGLVKDPNYVHTDNNFDTASKQEVDNIGKGSLTVNYAGQKIGSFGANANEDVVINIPKPTYPRLPVMIPDKETLLDHSEAVIDETKPFIAYEANVPLNSLQVIYATGGTPGRGDTEIYFSVASEKFVLDLSKDIRPADELGKDFVFQPGVYYVITLHMGIARLSTIFDPLVPAKATV